MERQCQAYLVEYGLWSTDPKEIIRNFKQWSLNGGHPDKGGHSDDFATMSHCMDLIKDDFPRFLAKLGPRVQDKRSRVDDPASKYTSSYDEFLRKAKGDSEREQERRARAEEHAARHRATKTRLRREKQERADKKSQQAAQIRVEQEQAERVRVAEAARILKENQEAERILKEQEAIEAERIRKEQAIEAARVLKEKQDMADQRSQQVYQLRFEREQADRAEADRALKEQQAIEAERIRKEQQDLADQQSQQVYQLRFEREQADRAEADRALKEQQAIEAERIRKEQQAQSSQDKRATEAATMKFSTPFDIKYIRHVIENASSPQIQENTSIPESPNASTDSLASEFENIHIGPDPKSNSTLCDKIENELDALMSRLKLQQTSEGDASICPKLSNLIMKFRTHTIQKP